MDKGYSILFNACTDAISQLQAVMVGLQKVQLAAEEIAMQTPSAEDEVSEQE